MAAWLLVVGVVIAVGLVISSAFSFWLALRQPDSLEELGVKPTYPRNALPEDKIQAYQQLKSKLQGEFAKDMAGDQWVCKLPPHAKDLLKYRLMQRAIGDMSLLQKIDADARGYWKLFSKGIITSKFWNSVLAAERELSQEIEALKLEALAIEPLQDPQGIVSEAMQLVVRYGDKIWEKFPEPPENPGGAAMAAAAKAVAAAGGMPRPGVPPAFAPTPGPPPPQQGGSTEAYKWRQDTEEVEISVHVPSDAAKADIKVQFQPKSLKVLHCGRTLVEGALAAPCCPEGCTWTLSKGALVVTLEKASPKPWPGLFAAKT
ncbi:nudcd1 [Symbiodinium microadriaticum]|nr:nudcd1 [Symbiodinium microadriaticum]